MLRFVFFVFLVFVCADARACFKRPVNCNVVLSSKLFTKGYEDAYVSLVESVDTTLQKVVQVAAKSSEVGGIFTFLGGVALRYGLIRTFLDAASVNRIQGYGLKAYVPTSDTENPFSEIKGNPFQNMSLWKTGFGSLHKGVVLHSNVDDFFPADLGNSIGPVLNDLETKDYASLLLFTRMLEGLMTEEFFASTESVAVFREEQRMAGDIGAAAVLSKNALQKAGSAYVDYIDASTFQPLNVGALYGERLTEYAAEVGQTTLVSYLMCRLNFLRYMNNTKNNVAQRLNDFAWQWGRVRNMYNKYACLSVLSTFASQGVISGLMGRSFYLGNILAWPEFNVWVSRWGLSGSLSTALKISSKVDVLLTYEGLIDAFSESSEMPYGDEEVVAGGMKQVFFKKYGGAMAGARRFLGFTRDVNITTEAGRDRMNSTAVFLARGVQEMILSYGSAARVKKHEFSAGFRFKPSMKSFVRGLCVFSTNKTPLGFSGSFGFQVLPHVVIGAGFDSLSRLSFKGDRLFHKTRKTEETTSTTQINADDQNENKQRETLFWFEISFR